MPTAAFDATDPRRMNMLRHEDWALCIGAGVCAGITPDWSAVTLQMLARARFSALTPADLEILHQELGWSLDSLLQYSLNAYELSGRSLEEFNDDLAKELYDGILDAASAAGLRDALVTLL